jgi:hypothetical protein
VCVVVRGGVRCCRPSGAHVEVDIAIDIEIDIEIHILTGGWCYEDGGGMNEWWLTTDDAIDVETDDGRDIETDDVLNWWRLVWRVYWIDCRQDETDKVWMRGTHNTQDAVAMMLEHAPECSLTQDHNGMLPIHHAALNSGAAAGSITGRLISVFSPGTQVVPSDGLMLHALAACRAASCSPCPSVPSPLVLLRLSLAALSSIFYPLSYMMIEARGEMM